MLDQEHYVPILKGREGEFGALRTLDDAAKVGMTPLIEIAPIPWDFENSVPAKTIDKHLMKLADRLDRAWGRSHKLFIDLLWIGESERMETGQHPVSYVFDAARSRGVCAVPVLGMLRSAEYVNACANAVQQDKRGVCLRLQREDLVEFENIETALLELLDRVGVTANNVDLIFDLRGLLITDSASSVAAMLERIPFARQWQSMTLAGTSFPPNLTGLPPSDCSLIERNEWQVWRGVCNGRLQRRPSFGDYAISHPEPSEVDPRIMRPSASIRYTADGRWLILKGRNLRDHGYGQFHKVCRDLMKRAEYAGAQFSWGDKYIAECAAGVAGTGNLTTWRKVGTSHHLNLIVRDLTS